MKAHMQTMARCPHIHTLIMLPFLPFQKALQPEFCAEPPLTFLLDMLFPVLSEVNKDSGCLVFLPTLNIISL